MESRVIDLRNCTLWPLVFLAVAGCYSYSPVDVHVVDVATNQPLAGIPVEVDYLRFMEFFPPKLDHVRTDVNGVAELSVCTNYKDREWVVIHLAHDAPYLLDQDFPASYIDVPVSAIRNARGSPYRVDLNVLGIQEHRRRFPGK